MTDWTIITRSLTSRTFSTVITALTVAVAVALMLVLLTLKDAGRRAFERGSGDMHMLVSADSSPLVSVLNSVFYANPPRRPLDWKTIERLRTSLPIGGNGYAVPTQQGDSFRGWPVLATSRDFFDRFRPNPGESWTLRDGRVFNAPFEVVLGARVARATGLSVGDKIYLTHGMSNDRVAGDVVRAGEDAHAHDEHDHDHEHEHEHEHADEHAGADAHLHRDFAFLVVGILNPTGGSHDRALIVDMTSAWIVHAHDRRARDAQTDIETTEADLTDDDRKVTGLYVRLATREGSDTPANLPQVFDTLRRDTSITVASPSDEIRKLFIIIGNIDQIFVALAAAVMLSSAIAIMLALYNSMEQRRRQIAVLRVLGCSRPRIFGLILTEAALVGMLGAAAGVGLALLGARVAAGALRARVGLTVDAAPDSTVTIVILAAAILLATVAGLIPAAMAYRTSVAKNLRPLG